ncbi:hypothetical protein H0H93_012505 [Arthromyces matolae]|nr:hypothetical protein H0H93_012505 [Arthromyces matolae]
MTIVGSDPVEKDNSQGGAGPQGYADKPGLHRYIGVIMVIGLAFAIFILWLSFGRWPRRKMREWGWLKQLSEAEEESGAIKEKPRVVDAIILPTQPQKIKSARKGSDHRGRHAVASWEADIDYKVNWEMKQYAYYEPRRVVPPDRTDYMPPERQSRSSP